MIVLNKELILMQNNYKFNNHQALKKNQNLMCN